MKKNNLNNNIGYQSPKVLNWLSARTDAPILAASAQVKTTGQEVETHDYSDVTDEEWQSAWGD